ncbi:MAG: hypothetical protein KH847_03470, partial [Clostridiales bacterium]|nr:hypothetical protein [Clostridiales bacterium]
VCLLTIPIYKDFARQADNAGGDEPYFKSIYSRQHNIRNNTTISALRGYKRRPLPHQTAPAI